MEKIMEEVDSWFMAQMMSNEDNQREEVRTRGRKKDWKLPPYPWLKCNSAVKWDSTTKTAGGAWVLRDYEGVVLLHSRRSFGAICSLEDARLVCLSWTLESLVAHKVNRVFLAAESAELLKMLIRPKAWPSFKAHFLELRQFLVRIVEWRIEIVSRSENRGAFLIAQSALKESFCQSYVACSHPDWLHDLFVSEKRLASA
ncbi:unnamed protein product [Microthlaspi erraticum]|uniref:RNase H type-1 domain-containing protein n=1 Tax=Microthlaspi erraticum TaxID=1685480 RepID=A0A6D2K2E7_9BRAS|nr:unnamed protein product [Microthlaspi erraticum]